MSTSPKFRRHWSKTQMRHLCSLRRVSRRRAAEPPPLSAQPLPWLLSPPPLPVLVGGMASEVISFSKQRSTECGLIHEQPKFELK
mmetsp:Transcript_113187/g.199820  ORF Transcript_113187/g.199820 Transcript_113187/m.199820 type:complete len:85 (+) Transcript_113187:384-638(+)